MLETYPPDLRDFVIQKIADGSFRTADEFAVQAASLYRELDNRHHDLQQQVDAGLQQLNDGKYQELADTDSLQVFFEQIKSRGRVQLGDSTSGR
jgi:hypothetical protein